MDRLGQVAPRAAAPILLAMVMAGCGPPRYTFPGTVAVATNDLQSQGLRLRVEWVKLKGKAIDAIVVFENRYTYPIVLHLGGIHLAYNGRPGMLGSNVGQVEILAGQAVRTLLIYHFAPEVPRRGGMVTIQADGIVKGTITKPEDPLPPLSVKIELKREYLR